MFRTFRKKPRQQENQEPLRTSPSLPELSSQGVAWPEDLVDVRAIRGQTPENEQAQYQQAQSPTHGATKTSFQISPSNRTPIPFHKPWPGGAPPLTDPNAPPQGQNGQGGTISSLYMKHPHPPSAFDNRRQSVQSHGSRTRQTQRRTKVAPTFNLMVVGGQGTGKTSLLRLLLDTADISPTATQDQRVAVDRFMRGGAKPTDTIQAACVEICESRFDRVLFSVIDTPGLDFHEGRELVLERQLGRVVRYLDQQYADTMSEESKVVRQSKGDQHVHLCIYMIDPSTIMSPQARRQLSSLPSKTRSETTISHPTHPPHPDTPSATEESDDSDAEEEEEETPESSLTMSPAEIRVIKRLSARTNVLPIIGRADSLTDEKLERVKETVRRELARSGLGFGVFGPARPRRGGVDVSTNGKGDAAEEALDGEEGDESTPTPQGSTPASPLDINGKAIANGNGNGHGRVSFSQNGHGPASEDSEDDDEDDNANNSRSPSAGANSPDPERRSRPVIKLRTGRNTNSSTTSHSVRRSRSRQRETIRGELEPTTPDPTDMESVPNVRFSAHIVARADLGELLPFAVIAPERWRKRAKVSAKREKKGGKKAEGAVEASEGQTEGGVNLDASVEGTDSVAASSTPASPSTRSMNLKANTVPLPYSGGPPEDLKGVFVRKFRWGSVDVLEPAHCDFAALRTAVLSTHLRMLKTHTKEVLYEKYRTEKLLARRATRNIGEVEARKLLEDLGL